MKYTNKLPLKLIYLFIALILVSATSQAADGYPVSEIPAELKEGVHAVVRNNVTHVKVEKAGRVIISKTYAVTVLDEKGKRYAGLAAYYDTELNKINTPSGNLYDAGGKRIAKLKKSDIEDISAYSSGSVATSGRYIVAELEHHQFPYTVEYSYERTILGWMPYPAWNPIMGTGTSVEKADLYLSHPEDFQLDYTSINWDIKPDISKGGNGENLLHWSARSMKAKRREFMSPEAPNPVIYFRYGEIVAGDTKGSMETWESMGKLIYELNKGRDDLPEELKKKVHELTSDINDPYEKISALYHFLQENTRYVSIQLGIGGYQAYDAGYVYENGYGDCKALSNYMKAMLKEVNIPSHCAVIWSEVNPAPMITEFAHLNFNHMVLCVPFEQDTLWLECTSDSDPAGFADAHIEDRGALLLTEDGGKLVKTPKLKPEQNLQKSFETITLDADGNGKLTAHHTHHGYHAGIISYLQTETEENQKKLLRNYFINLGSYKIEDYSLNHFIDSRLPVGELEYTLDVKNIAGASGGRLFLSFGGDRAGIDIPPSIKNRTQDLSIKMAELIQDSIIYILPEGMSIESKPEMPIEIKTEFSSYKADLQMISPTKLLYTRELRMEKMTLPPSYYKIYRDFMRDVSRADKTQIVLMGKS